MNPLYAIECLTLGAVYLCFMHVWARSVIALRDYFWPSSEQRVQSALARFIAGGAK